MGPLAGIRVVEIGGIGPIPFAGMLLADHGADVVRIERPDPLNTGSDILFRSRRILTLDLKKEESITQVRALVREADVVIEGYRPGVMERLGLGPDVLLADRPSLIYGRMTGWGQTGPYASYPGHDLNYIALSGALNAIGPNDGPPIPPLALAGDFGGGGMLLAFSVCAAALHVRNGGKGQVIDCSMTEGSGLLMAQFYSMVAAGLWRDKRGVNVIDGASHFYNAYETADGLYVSIAAEEVQFYRAFREALGLADDPAFDAYMDPAAWPGLKKKVAAVFRTKTRDEWCALLEDKSLCFAPVLSMSEAPSHPQAVARESFVEVDGIVQPAPAPRYSASPLAVPSAPKTLPEGAREIWQPREGG